MAKSKAPTAVSDIRPSEMLRRDRDLSGTEEMQKKLVKLFATVEKGFTDQRDRGDEIMDYWDAYNCVLGSRQFYQGNSKLYIPIIEVAVNARKTRFTNQVFPQNGRNVEAITTDGEIPHATIALIEKHIARARLRSEVVPATFKQGDIEGQYNVYVSWDKLTRHVVSRETKPVTVDQVEVPEAGEVETIVEEAISDAGPSVEVLMDGDVLIWPVTADSVEKAIAVGGGVAVRRRWSEDQIQKKIDDGEILEEPGEALIESMGKITTPSEQSAQKKNAEAAGIHLSGERKFALVYEVWTRLRVPGEKGKRICVSYYGGDEIVLGCRRNPYWCDRVPVISHPVEKVAQQAKGVSRLKGGVLDLQVWANDTANEAADQGHFAMFPIVMTDPERNPRVGTMVMDLAAVWQVDPKSTTIHQFPDTTQQALAKIGAAKQQIFEKLSVSPAMMPQQSGQPGRKRNQAEVALEQQVDILTTADAVTNFEEGVLTPLVQRFLEYDHQFRTTAMLVRSYGEMGMRAIMEEIPPQQVNHRWTLRWFGVEAAKNAQQIQQQIAAVNVIRGIPKEQYPGYTLDVTPLLINLAENAFGPRLAPLIFKDQKMQLAVEPKLENTMLEQGFDVAVHPLDNDPEHLKVHMELLKGGDPHGSVRVHIQKHQQSMSLKAQAMMMQAAQQGRGAQGVPGGAGPGVAGTPRPGGQVAGPRLLKGPAGMIAQDQMPRAGAAVPPRRA